MRTTGRTNTKAEVTRRPSVLIVDHDADTRSMYRTAFSSLEYNVDESSDGAEALGKALCRQPDVIITETQLPRINGFDLCRVLRTDPQTRSVRIVVVTGAPGAAASARAMSAGADVVLVRPCEMSTIVTAANDAVQRIHTTAVGAHSASPAPADTSASGSDAQLTRTRSRCKSRGFHRYMTDTPPIAPPDLRCPVCDGRLQYEHSYIGGVSIRAPEQWDRLSCRECGPYEYRHRTRKLAAGSVNTQR
jgi:CheY-like chemotaxis protein